MRGPQTLQRMCAAHTAPPLSARSHQPPHHTPASELSNLTMLNPRVVNGSAALLPAGRTAFFCVSREEGAISATLLRATPTTIGQQGASRARAHIPDSAKLFPPRA